ncbi:MAG: TolC family protein [Gemmatimonadota bacterium]
MNRSYGRRGCGAALITLLALSGSRGPAVAQQARPVELTLERMVELGLEDSYRVRHLQLGIDQQRARLNAERAGLKSRVDMEFSGPDLQSISDYKWDSDLQRDVLVHEDTRRWEAELAVSQPVILFGYPTNGRLSLNNRMYRYSQLNNEGDVRYYNRYFISYRQPLFQPNEMKNSLEEAQLDLESSELSYKDDIVRMISDLAEDYLEIFETAYEQTIAAETVAALEEAAAAAASVVAAEPDRAIETEQVEVTLANAREEISQAASRYRLQAAEIKQSLRLPQTDSLVIDPVPMVDPVEVDVEQAIAYATTLSPRMRRLAIDRREAEIDLDETGSWQAFRMDLNMTYGREVQDPRFDNLWERPRNSYTVNVDAYVPIWDWGQRDYRLQAERYNLERLELRVEEAEIDIRTSIENQVRNLEEYEQRALSMQANLERARQITRSTIESYAAGQGTLVDVLQTIDRQEATAENFLDAYIGWRESLEDLQRDTYWDFQRNAEVLDRFGIVVGGLQRLP